MLTIGVQTHGRAERRVGSRGACIAQRTGRADDGDGRHRREAQAHAQRHINRGNNRQSREGRTDAHGHQQADAQHGQCGHAFIAAEQSHAVFDQRLNLAGCVHYGGETLCRNHNKADHRHHFDAFAEHIAGGGAVHHAQHHKHGKAQHSAQYQRTIIQKLNGKTHGNRHGRHQAAIG